MIFLMTNKLLSELQFFMPAKRLGIFLGLLFASFLSYSQAESGKILLELQLKNGWHVLSKGNKESRILKYGRFCPSLSGAVMFKLKKRVFLGPHFQVGYSREVHAIEKMNQPQFGPIWQNYINHYNYFQAGMKVKFLKPIRQSENMGIFLDLSFDFCKLEKENFDTYYIFDWHEIDGTQKFIAMNWKINSTGKPFFTPSVSLGFYLKTRSKNYFSIGTSFSFATVRAYKSSYTFYKDIDPNYPGDFSEIYTPEFSRSGKSGPTSISIDISYLFSFLNKS